MNKKNKCSKKTQPPEFSVDLSEKTRKNSESFELIEKDQQRLKKVKEKTSSSSENSIEIEKQKEKPEKQEKKNEKNKENNLEMAKTTNIILKKSSTKPNIQEKKEISKKIKNFDDEIDLNEMLYNPNRNKNEEKALFFEENDGLSREIKPTKYFSQLLNKSSKEFESFCEKNQKKDKKTLENEEIEEESKNSKKLAERKKNADKPSTSSESEEKPKKPKIKDKKSLKISSDESSSKNSSDKSSPSSESEENPKKSKKTPKKPKNPEKKSSKSSDKSKKVENSDIPEEFLKKSQISPKESQTLDELNTRLLKLNEEKSSFYISEKRSLLKKAEEYLGNLQIRTTIEKAAKSYSFRAVKGDGNCSYRSIAFLYLEQILNNIKKIEDLQRKKPVKKFFERIIESNFEVFINKNRENAEIKEKILENRGLLKKYLIKMLLDLIKLRISKVYKEEFSEEIVKTINKNPLFDFAIIVLFRALLKSFFVKNREEYQPFIAENLNYEKTIGEIDLEGDHTIIKFASDLFRIQINIVNIESEFKIFDPFIPKKCELNEIHMYFRHGHYDILYKEENFKNFNERIKPKIFDKNIRSVNERIKPKILEKYDNMFEGEKFFEKAPKINEKICNKCDKKKDNSIKSRRCDHIFCVDCIFDSGQAGKENLNCLVCNSEMMTMNELEKMMGL